MTRWRWRAAWVATPALLVGTVAVVTPASPAFAASTTVAYVAERVGFVRAVDTETQQTIRRIDVGDAPWRIAATPNGSSLFVTDNGSASVSRIETATNTVSATIPVGNGPRAVAVTPDGSRVYVANDQSDSVTVIDATDNTVITTITAGGNPQELAIAPDGDTVYVANRSSSSISVIDTGTNTVSRTINGIEKPTAIAVSPDGDRLYVTRETSTGTVAVINAATGTVTSSSVVSNTPLGIVLTSNGSRAYVAGFGPPARISVLDTATNGVVATIPIEPGNAYMAFNPDGSRLYIADEAGGKVTAIDTASNTVATTLTGFTSPKGIAVVDVDVPRASLNLSITDSADPVSVGSEFEYRYAVLNNGPDTAAGVVLNTHFVGVQRTVVSATSTRGTCTIGTGGISCAIGSLADETTATVTVRLKALDDGSLTARGGVNTTTYHPTNSALGDEEGTTIVPNSADLAVTVAEPTGPVIAGHDVAFTATITNNGPDTAGTVIGRINFSGVARTIVSATGGPGSCTTTTGVGAFCNLGALAPGATATVTVTVKPLAAGQLSANGRVSSGNPDDLNNANNSVTVSTTVAPRSADLKVTVTDSPDPVTVGDDISYTAIVTNDGPEDATAVKAVIDLNGPAHTIVSATSTSGTCTTATAKITCEVGDLAADANATITATVKPQAAGTVEATATVTATETDPADGDNTATAETDVEAPPSADLGVSLTDSPDPVLNGGTVTYTATVTNQGPDGATGVEATIGLTGAAHTVVSVTSDHGTCTTTSCDLGTLADGATATVTAAVKPTAAGTLTAKVTVTATEDDPAAANNTDEEDTTVPPAADLRVSLTDTPDPAALGDTYAYSAVVTNDGPDAATGVSVTVDLTGSARTVLAATSTQGTCTIAAAVVTCAIGGLAEAGTATVTLVVEPQATGTVGATATVTGTPADPRDADNKATQSTVVSNINGCTIIGTAGNNILMGTPGADVICALGGNDTVTAGGGNDRVYAGSGTDTVTADDGADVVFGGFGNDIMSGAPGNDALDGGAGTDTANGGPGTDTCTTSETLVSCNP